MVLLTHGLILYSTCCFLLHATFLIICKCKLIHLLGYLCTICFLHQHENWWGQWPPLILLLLLFVMFSSLYPQGWAQYLAHSRGIPVEKNESIVHSYLVFLSYVRCLKMNSFFLQNYLSWLNSFTHVFSAVQI